MVTDVGKCDSVVDVDLLSFREATRAGLAKPLSSGAQLGTKLGSNSLASLSMLSACCKVRESSYIQGFLATLEN